MTTNEIDVFSPNNLIAFAPERDFLNQRPFAEKIKDVILGSTNPEVFSINAPWGSGKTFFIKELKLLFEETDSAFCIKYNAWESDYFNDPFLPLICELTEGLENIDKKRLKLDELPADFDDCKKGVNKLIEKIKETAISFHTASLNASIPIIDPTTGMPLANIGGQIGFQKTEDIFKQYIKFKDELNKFKTILTLLQNKIGKPLIIFIDELDRCRPDYAIKTLEVVKHFFIGNEDNQNKANIKFIISIDRTQITNTVKTMYGNPGDEKEIDGYLKKFFDIDFYLPKPELNSYILVLMQNLMNQSYFNKLNPVLIKNSNNNKNEIDLFISALCEPLNTSLRDVERIFYKLDKILRQISQQAHTTIFLEFLIILLILNVKDYNFYKELCSESKDSAFLSKLNQHQIFNINSGNNFISYFNKILSILRHHWTNTHNEIIWENPFKPSDTMTAYIYSILKNSYGSDYISEIKNFRFYTKFIDFVDIVIKS